MFTEAVSLPVLAKWSDELPSCGFIEMLVGESLESCHITSSRFAYYLVQRLFSLCSHQIFEDCPIVHMIVIEALAHKEIPEDFTQIGICRFVVKVRGADVVEISREFPRETLTKFLCIDCLLLLQDQFLPLRVILGCETLPRERASEEVEQHIS